MGSLSHPQLPNALNPRPSPSQSMPERALDRVETLKSPLCIRVHTVSPEFVRPVRRLTRSLWADGHGWILVFVAFGWALTIGTRHLLPVLFPHLREAFSLDLAMLGGLYSLVMATYALGQFPGGAIADRFGERAVLTASAFLSGFTMLILGIAVSVAILAAGMLLFGLASSLYGPTRYTIMSDIYPEFDGTAIGITQALGKIGDVILPVVAGLLAVYFTWRVGFLYLVPLYLVATVGLWTVVPRQTSGETSALDELSPATARYIARHVSEPTPVHLTVILALTLFVVQGVTSFFPIYLVDAKGVPPVTATIMFGLLFASGILIQPLAGALGDIIDPRLTVVSMFAVLVVALAAFPRADSIYQLVIITLLLCSLWGILPALVPILTASLPLDMRGVGFGFLRTVYLLIASAGSLTVGALAERTLFDEAFYILAAVCATALVLSLPIKSR